MRTLDELEVWMRERDLSMQIFCTRDACIVVWVFAQDDPELGVSPGEGSTLNEAIADACKAWDQPSQGRMSS